MKLSSIDRNKIDNSDDEIFYQQPRYVHHLSLSFRNRLTRLYTETLRENTVILDLMSSWVSHLPENIKYKRVIGHGLNNSELKANNRLDEYWIQNLNKNQKLPLNDSSIDFGLIVAGWQYLQFPETISLELSRIIKPNSSLIVSFTNRAFWTKSPNIWSNSSEYQRIDYVKNILDEHGWRVQTIFNEKTINHSFLGILNSEGDPFFSIVAINNKTNN